MKDPFKGKEFCFGVHMSPVGDFRTIKENCLNAENLGYNLVTVWDHLMGFMGLDQPMECWTVLAGLAAVTDSIQLGTLVSCVHFRHPTVLAKMAVTVDLISGGRLILGLGAGWFRDEFESFLGRFPVTKERLDGLEDAVIICKSMLKEEHTDYQGKLFSAKNISREHSTPRPARGFIPIMIGGSGERRTLKIAAKHADIIHITSPAYPPMLERKVQAIKKHCNNIGRDFDELVLSTFIHPMLEESKEKMDARIKYYSSYQVSESVARKMYEVTAGPENIIKTIRSCNDLGIRLFTISQLDPKLLETFKNEVVTKI